MVTDELITNSYYLSNIVGRDLSSVAGSQLSDGLDMLNDILSELSSDGKYITYFNHFTVAPVVGQEKYSLPGTIEVSAVTFNIGDVRYSMRRVSRSTYFGTSRVDNITTLPYQYFVERSLNGSDLYLYFSPEQSIDVIDVTAKSIMNDVTADQIISDFFDRFFISYLKYELAGRICEFNDIDFTPAKELRRRRLKKMLINIAPRDLTMLKISPFSTERSYNYGDINLGRGWRP